MAVVVPVRAQPEDFMAPRVHSLPPLGLIIPAMQLKLKRRSWYVALVAYMMAGFSLSLSAKDFAKPVAQPAKTYPVHDDHSDEKVAIAADPYDTAEKAKI